MGRTHFEVVLQRPSPQKDSYLAEEVLLKTSYSDSQKPRAQHSLRSWEICAALYTRAFSKVSWWRELRSRNPTATDGASPEVRCISLTLSPMLPGGYSRAQEVSTLSWQLGKTTPLSDLKHKPACLQAGSGSRLASGRCCRCSESIFFGAVRLRTAASC